MQHPSVDTDANADAHLLVIYEAILNGIPSIYADTDADAHYE